MTARSTLLWLIVFSVPAPAFAVCTEPDKVAAVRDDIARQCDCETAASHRAYVQCARAVVATAIDEGRLSPTCRGAVNRCTSKSTCGRPGYVTCLRTTSRGVRCSLKRSGPLCTAKAGSCVGASDFCCDTDAGCFGATTTTVPGATTTTTPGPDTTTTTTPGATTTTVPAATTTTMPGATTTTMPAATTTTLPGGGTTTTLPSATTTTTVAVTTTTAPPATTTTTTVPPPPLVCTDPALRFPALGHMPVTVTPGTTDCGGPSLNPPAASPFSGELDASGTKIKDLGTGCLYLGSGRNTLLPGGRIADGTKLVLDIVGLQGSGGAVLGPSPGTGPKDCTLPSGPGRHCVDGSPGTDGHGRCTSDADCAGFAGSCALDANCFFGPPLPLPAPAQPFVSTCVVNVFEQGACGQIDLLAGTASVSAGLSARAYLTGNATEPCPRCVSGVCDGGENAGGTCQAVGSAGTSTDCPPTKAFYAGAIPVVLPGTSTEPLALADPSRILCPGQPVPGAFGRQDVDRIATHGSRFSPINLLLGLLNPTSQQLTLAGPFCIPSSGNGGIDTATGLPGPGAVSIGTTVDTSALLRLILFGPPPTTTTTTIPTTTTTTVTTTTTAPPPTTTTTTATVPTTLPGSTSTTTSTSTSTTTVPVCSCSGGAPTRLSFTTTLASGTCGNLQNDAGTAFASLACGGLYFGGAGVGVPLPSVIPDQATSVTNVTGCSGTALTLAAASAADTGSNRTCSAAGCLFGPPLPIPNSSPGGSATSTCVINTVAQNAAGTADCSSGATSGLNLPLSSGLFLTGDLLANRCSGGSTPGASCTTAGGACPGGGTCANDTGRCTGGTSPANTACVQDADCAGGGACLTGQCAAGTKAGFGCSIDADCPGGTCRTFIQPCPICNATTHVCNGGPNDGLGCTPGDSAVNGDLPTSHDCPPPSSANIGSLPIAFLLNSGTVGKTAVDLPDQPNVFCGFCRNKVTNQFKNPAVPCTSNATCSAVTGFTSCGQRTPGAFTANDVARTINETGAAAGALTTGGAAAPSKLVSAFCIPPTFNPLVDSAADLPGPGAVFLQGTVRLQ